MVGPSPAAQGGVASVVAAYAEAGLFADGNVLMLSSFVAGKGLTKLRVALAAWLRYFIWLLRGRGAVLHVHVSSHASFWRKALFIWAAVLARRKVVFHLHGGGFRAFVEGLPPLLRALALATVRRSDCLLCLTGAVADWLRSIAPGLPVLWWPNPVPVSLFQARVPEQAREPVVLYLGALLPAKGLPDLLRGFCLLQAQRAEARLVIGGSGPELDGLHALVDELGLSGAVSFPGWLDAGQKAELLARCRMLVLPSHLEAQPMVLLEAMAAGAALVSTDVGGVPDLVTDGEHGLLVRPGQPAQIAQAMLRLWDDEALRSELAMRARAKVQSVHSADKVCAELLAIYAGLAAKRR